MKNKTTSNLKISNHSKYKDIHTFNQYNVLLDGLKIKIENQIQQNSKHKFDTIGYFINSCYDFLKQIEEQLKNESFNIQNFANKLIQEENQKIINSTNLIAKSSKNKKSHEQAQLNIQIYQDVENLEIKLSKLASDILSIEPLNNFNEFWETKKYEILNSIYSNQ